MTRPYNFSGGPATLPEPVLAKIQAELLNWRGTGVSILETSHRSADFMALNLEVQQKLRQALMIPKNYQILLVTGPSRTQFSMVPQNLLAKNPQADYWVTGLWSDLAAKEAQRYGDIALNQNRPDSAYCYYCPNETVHGLWTARPKVNIPIVADMTSSLLTQPIDISHYGVIFAGTQKNMGPAGLTVVIIREDLMQVPQPATPTIATYQKLAEQDSLLYTPNCFAVYCLGLVLDWLSEQGGLTAIGQMNQTKADLLYHYIDSTDFYHNPITKSQRSLINIIFNLKNRDLEPQFLTEAHRAGLLSLRGHRMVGGIRVSCYNAMPRAGVEKLIEFMQRFSHDASTSRHHD